MSTNIAMPLDKNKTVEATIKIPFDSIEHAEIAYRTLNIDEEPKRNFVIKSLRLADETIEVHFTANQKQIMPEHTPAPTPHRAIYGYAFYLLVITLFVFYLLWALLPTKEWGLTYLPDKYFALLLPMLVLVGLSLFAFFIYPAINMSLTAEIDEMASVADVRLILKGKLKSISSWKELQQQLTLNSEICDQSIEDSLLENCKYCLENHCKRKVSEKIATVRFMDLAEINRKLIK